MKERPFFSKCIFIIFAVINKALILIQIESNQLAAFGQASVSLKFIVLLVRWSLLTFSRYLSKNVD